MDPIRVISLGEGGVNVDNNPLRTDDNQTLSSQNASHDGTRKRLGGLSKRPGLDRFNGDPMDGAVLGGIEAPYRGTAGAPASGGGGGGAAGDAGGTGEPGGIGPGDSVGADGGVAQGGQIFSGGSSKLFGGRRLLLIGRTQNSASTDGWYLTSEGIQDLGWKLNSDVNVNAGPPGPALDPGVSSGEITAGQPAWAVSQGVLYYAQHAQSLAASTSPTLPVIRRMSADGNTDVPILTIPDNHQVLSLNGTPPSHRSSILAFATDPSDTDLLYVTVYDEVTTGSDAGDYGRIIRVTGLNSGAYSQLEVFNVLTTAESTLNDTPCVPICAAFYLGFPTFGVFRGSQAGDPVVFSLRYDGVGPNGWSACRVGSTSDPAECDLSTMWEYHGRLYIGTIARDPTVSFAKLRSIGANWLVDGADTITEFTSSGGVALDANRFVSSAVFNDKLYVSYVNPGVAAKIYQYDGTTWTTVYTAGTAGERVGLNLRVDGDYLYAFGGTTLTIAYFYVTTDGTTWTAKRTNLIGTSANGQDFNISTPVNVLFGMDQ